MQRLASMKNLSRMLTKKKLDSVLKGVIAAMPAIPYIMKPKKAPIAAYVIGGLSFAVAGGMVALMLFSPRTRTKALSAAKDGFSKVKGGIRHLRPASNLLHRHDEPGDLSNGIMNHDDFQPSTTGL